MRRALAAAGLSALALVVTGCGGVESTGDASPPGTEAAATATTAELGPAERFLASVRGSRALVAAFHPL